MAEGAFSVRGDDTPSGIRALLRPGTILPLIFLLVCSGVSAWIYIKMMGIMSVRGSSTLRREPQVDREGIAEARDLETLGIEYVSMRQVTDMVVQTAMLAETSSREPVARLAASFPPETFQASVVIDSDIPQELELDPPMVELVAVMIVSPREKIAMINVVGEESGAVVREGHTFSGGTAKITKIDEKSVTYRWMEKTITVSIQ